MFNVTVRPAFYEDKYVSKHLCMTRFIKTIIRIRNPLTAGEVYWAVGEVTILKEILCDQANLRIHFIYLYP